MQLREQRRGSLVRAGAASRTTTGPARRRRQSVGAGKAAGRTSSGRRRSNGRRLAGGARRPVSGRPEKNRWPAIDLGSFLHSSSPGNETSSAWTGERSHRRGREATDGQPSNDGDGRTTEDHARSCERAGGEQPGALIQCHEMSNYISRGSEASTYTCVS